MVVKISVAANRKGPEQKRQDRQTESLQSPHTTYYKSQASVRRKGSRTGPSPGIPITHVAQTAVESKARDKEHLAQTVLE